MNADGADERRYCKRSFTAVSSALYLRFICAICVLLLTCGDADRRSLASLGMTFTLHAQRNPYTRAAFPPNTSARSLGVNAALATLSFMRWMLPIACG